MIKKISVRKDQLALLSRNGDYYKVLHAGEHLLPWLNTPEVLLITLDGSEVPDVLADYLRRFQPDWVEKYCLVADLSEIEAGIEAVSTRLEALKAYETLLTSTSVSGTSILSDSKISLSGNPTADDIKNWISNLESSQEELGTDIQQQMVFVQDYMGQYNSYTQGASSAISKSNEVLTALATGR